MKSSNLDDFMFLSISPNFKNPEKISLDNFPLFTGNCKEYVIAFYKSSDKLYKLKGFRINDFSSFIQLLKKLNYPRLNSYRRFINYYQIDNVELGCLYKAFKNYRSNNKKNSCLSDCVELTTVN